MRRNGGGCAWARVFYLGEVATRPKLYFGPSLVCLLALPSTATAAIQFGRASTIQR